MITLKARMTNYGVPRYRWLTHAWNYFQREVSTTTSEVEYIGTPSSQMFPTSSQQKKIHVPLI